jgi:transcription elongation factor GreA
LTIYDDESENESTYRIVGEDEADIKRGLISVSSPVAKALIGHRVGDEVQVKVPSGIRIYEIIDIKYV